MTNEKKFTYNDLKLKINIIKNIFENDIQNNRIGILLNQGINYGASIVSIPLTNNVGVLLTKKWKKFEILNTINSANINYIISDNEEIYGIKNKVIANFDNLFLLKLETKFKLKLSKKMTQY